LNGKGPIWNAGGRWQPNVDSSILVLYGRSEFSDHFSAEFEWQITPITELTGRYVDGIGNPQSSLLGGLGLFPGGIINTPIGQITLPPNFNLPPGLAQQNNVFHSKTLTADLRTILDRHELHLTVYRTTRTSLTNIGPREDSSTG